MKIDFSQTLKNIDGSEMPMDASTPTTTLVAVVQHALLSPQESDARATGPEKVKLYTLAVGLAAEEKDYPVEDIALMKKRVAAMPSPLVVGQVWQMLDGAEAPTGVPAGSGASL